MGRRTIALGAVALCGLVVLAWFGWWPTAERRIERRLHQFAADFNASTADGLGTVARAARIGSYFTHDVVVDLGPNTPPIHGRETLIGMASRLQPRTAAFRLELLDVTVTPRSDALADVSLTAAFGRSVAARDGESVDARELAITMVETGGEWRMSRVRIVEPFR